MIARALSLVITTPLQVVTKVDSVNSFRALDKSGGFGVMPGHIDFLTVLTSCVTRWRHAKGPWTYCAVRGGVLTVSQGQAIRIACREAIVGDDLGILESQVMAQRDADRQSASSARILQAKLHAKAIRQIMHHLRRDDSSDAIASLDGMLQ